MSLVMMPVSQKMLASVKESSGVKHERHTRRTLCHQVLPTHSSLRPRPPPIRISIGAITASPVSLAFSPDAFVVGVFQLMVDRAQLNGKDRVGRRICRL
jgi:hypothetical protein